MSIDEEQAEWMDAPLGPYKEPVAEGDTCPKCNRRVPHAPKKSSPKTRVFSVRVPLDDADVFSETVDATAEHLGLKHKPHGRYFALMAALALALQSPAGVLDGES